MKALRLVKHQDYVVAETGWTENELLSLSNGMEVVDLSQFNHFLDHSGIRLEMRVFWESADPGEYPLILTYSDVSQTWPAGIFAAKSFSLLGDMKCMIKARH